MICLRFFHKEQRSNAIVILLVLILSWFLLMILDKEDCSFSQENTTGTTAAAADIPPIPSSPTDSYSSSTSTGGSTPSTNIVDAKEQLFASSFNNNGQQQHPWLVPGEINRLRRYMALHDPQSYEHNFSFFANEFKSRSKTVRKHLMLHIPKAGGTSICDLADKHFKTSGRNCWYSYFGPTWCCGAFEDRFPTYRVLRSGEDCSLMDNDFPDFVMNENWLDHVMCMEHRMYSISIREPVSRAMSQENHLWHFDQKDQNYQNLTERLELARNNYMTWSLSSGHIVGDDPVTRSPLAIEPQRIPHLAIARDKLSRLDFILDVIELPKYKDCEASILNLMGFPDDESIPHANSAKRVKKLEYEKDEYEKRNILDIELYQFALTLIKVDCEFFVRLNHQDET